MSNSDNSWLSTRNKSKLPSKPVCLKKRTSLSKPMRSQQSHGSSGYTMTQSSPPPKQLFTATKQSKLNEYFRSVDSQSSFQEEKEANRTDAHANPCITKQDIYDNLNICDTDSAKTKQCDKTDIINICQNEVDRQNINSDQCRLSDSIQNKESLSDYCSENIQGKKAAKDYHKREDFDYGLIPNERTSPLQESSQNSINELTEKYTKRSSGTKRLFPGEEPTERGYCKRQKVLKQRYKRDIDVLKVEDDTAYSHHNNKADIVSKRKGCRLTSSERINDIGVLNVKDSTTGTVKCAAFPHNDTCNIKVDIISKVNGGRHTTSDEHKESTSDIEHNTESTAAGINSNSKYKSYTTDGETDSNSSLNLSKEDTFDLSLNNSLSKAETLDVSQKHSLSETKALDLSQNKSLCSNDTSAVSQVNSLSKDETLDISQSNSLSFDTQALSNAKEAHVNDSFSLNLECDTELHLGDTEEADDQSLELHTQYTL